MSRDYTIWNYLRWRCCWRLRLLGICSITVLLSDGVGTSRCPASRTRVLQPFSETINAAQERIRFIFVLNELQNGAQHQ